MTKFGSEWGFRISPLGMRVVWSLDIVVVGVVVVVVVVRWTVIYIIML